MKKKFLPISVIVLSAILSIFFITPSFACEFDICKFNDLNGNGVQDAGEPNIPGWLIRIYDNMDVLKAEATTGDDGCAYFHLNITGITYKVWEEQVECWEATAPEAMVFWNGGYYVEVPVPPEGGSQHFIDFGNMYACGEGCTPGYWRQKQHFDSWVGFEPTDLFSDVFGETITIRFGKKRRTIEDPTLRQALKAKGGGINALARHTVAALLNASSPDVSYDLSVDDVIDEFKDVYPGTKEEYNNLKNYFEGFNEQGCPLN
jgi:hypothetical protein